LKKPLTQCEEYGVDASYGGSKVTRVPIPKVHIYFNTRMKKIVENQF
jgi:hypothetical protein